ncbi:MAG: addiction module antitoxin [Alphaproteobacteria bacterium]|nr:addiction module antitoxin [Alphaproteobacteria bacterium]
MHKKLTITMDENIYAALHAVIGRGNISRFLEDLARPHVLKAMPLPDDAELERSYTMMADDSAREAETLEWIESGIDDGLNEAW